jgi:hypothetical protein
MVVNVIIRRIAGVFAAVSLLATGVALEMPPEGEEAFRKASIGEDGYYPEFGIMPSEFQIH